MQQFRNPFGTNVMGSVGDPFTPTAVPSFDDVFGPTPVGYGSRPILPRTYGASMAPPMTTHRDSAATDHRDSNTSALSDMNLFSRNNSVTNGTAVAMPNPSRQAMQQSKVDELIGAGNGEDDFNPADFIDEAMLRLGEEV